MCVIASPDSHQGEAIPDFTLMHERRGLLRRLRRLLAMTGLKKPRWLIGTELLEIN